MMKRVGKFKTQILVLILALAMFGLSACVQSTNTQTEVPQASPTLTEAPAWTATPQTPTVPSTATRTPISNTPTPTLLPSMTPAPVIFSVSGGNLNVRRGPDLAYNYVGVLYDGDAAVAIGRDKQGDWLLIEIPSNSDITGWVTTETEYSTVEGEIQSLPLVEVDPPDPAFLRNCTKHTILVEPVGVELLNKYNDPDNEAHFDVLTYQLYDLDVAGNPRLEDLSLVEGARVDILYDGNGDKSKCE